MTRRQEVMDTSIAVWVDIRSLDLAEVFREHLCHMPRSVSGFQAYLGRHPLPSVNEIRYLGRVREREKEKGLAYIWSGFLQWVAGFGIGGYTFRVLYWVIVITVFGALYLNESVKGVREEKHGFIWCFGAALSRLLPVIEINKEFTDFFNDPERKRLTGWQSFFFSTLSIIGWVLGLILIAAVSGLTQSS